MDNLPQKPAKRTRLFSSFVFYPADGFDCSQRSSSFLIRDRDRSSVKTMASEQKNSYGGAKSPDVFDMGQGTAGMGASGASQFGQPTTIQIRGPAVIFTNPGRYSVSMDFGGNMARTFGANVNPNPGRRVQFSGDTVYSKPHNPSARMPRESTPYPSRVQSPNATIVPLEQSPKYFNP